ncbi:hypothetical protein ZIOFF_006057 [Zingiber officinale]|uniref:Uncharacterized protein n=1 Tax=Zingiber officinale TaxID=94328 RepID=A0A8J5HN95_ZINOF|nr:hypothetical protein ZIOFF_006057 [Zingiber officinale]
MQPGANSIPTEPKTLVTDLKTKAQHLRTSSIYMKKSIAPVHEHYLVSEKHDEPASTAELNHTETQVRSSSPSHLLETDGKITESVVPEEEFVANGAVNLDSETVGQPGVQPLLVEARISEVGTVRFDEIQIYEDNKREMIINDDPVPHEEVPFTDAPLIGAPFRLISFMAKYVSGADLARRDDS